MCRIRCASRGGVLFGGRASALSVVVLKSFRCTITITRPHFIGIKSTAQDVSKCIQHQEVPSGRLITNLHLRLRVDAFVELLVYQFWRTELTASIVQKTIALGGIVSWREG